MPGVGQHVVLAQLDQPTTERHGEQLEPAAHTQQGQASLSGPLQCGELVLVALGVDVPCSGGVASVAARIDVAAAGQDHRVDQVERRGRSTQR